MKSKQALFVDNSSKLLIIGGIIISIITFLFLAKDIIYSLELSVYNFMSRESSDKSVLNPAYFNKADKDIVVLAMDDYSCQRVKNYPELKIGRIPWQRKVIAEMLNFVEKGNPKVVVLDLIFSGEEGFEKGNIESDKMLAKTLSQNKNVVLTNIFYKNSKALNNQYPAKLTVDVKKLDSQENNEIARAILFNDYEEILPDFLKRVSNLGAANTVYDPSDNIIRSHRPVYSYNSNGKIVYIPSSALSVVQYLTKEKNITLKNNTYFLGDRAINVDKEGTFLINWHGKAKTYQNISAIKPLLSMAVEKGLIKQISPEDKMDPSVFKDKIVVIGMTRSGTDIHATPMDMRMPGPEIIATTIDNLLNDSNMLNKNRRPFLQKAPFSINLLITLCFGFIVGYWSYKAKSNFLSFVWLIAMIIAFIYLTVYLFVVQRYWIYITFPVSTMIFATLGVYVYKIKVANNAKNEVEKLFGKFVSPEVVKRLIETPGEISRTGQRKELTILFMDIRDFTTITERTPAQDLICQLNEFFDIMAEIIFRNGGTIDKYIGDSIMAFWGDPLPMDDHAIKAVVSAKEMIEALEPLNIKWQKEGKNIFRIGVGINTGEVIVGHLGSKSLLSYTVMGDDVNLASRLEGLNKQYGTSIIIGPKTYEYVKDFINIKELETVNVKGKFNAVKIFAVEV
jgi:adenylate cyclase